MHMFICRGCLTFKVIGAGSVQGVCGGGFWVPSIRRGGPPGWALTRLPGADVVGGARLVLQLPLHELTHGEGPQGPALHLAVLSWGRHTHTALPLSLEIPQD